MDRERVQIGCPVFVLQLFRHGSFISWCYEVTTSIFDAEEARNLTHVERRISNMPKGMDTVLIHLTRRVLRNLRAPITSILMVVLPYDAMYRFKLTQKLVPNRKR